MPLCRTARTSNMQNSASQRQASATFHFTGRRKLNIQASRSRVPSDAGSAIGHSSARRRWTGTYAEAPVMVIEGGSEVAVRVIAYANEKTLSSRGATSTRNLHVVSGCAAKAAQPTRRDEDQPP